MAQRILLAGTDIAGTASTTTRVLNTPGVVQHSDDLNTRSVLEIQAINVFANDMEIAPGQSLVVQDVEDPRALQTADGAAILTADGAVIQAPDVTNRFGGTVEDLEYTMLGDRTSTWRQVSLSAVSFDQIADRHIVYEVFENQTAGAIARNLVQDHLATDGVSVDGVQDGPPISFVVFNYISVAEAFNKLSDLTGMIWWIDADRVLRFQTRETTVAPFSITTADYKARKLKVRKTRDRYRNRQIIRGGRDLTVSRAESFVGDGERRTFTLAFPAGVEPTVTVDTGSGAVAKTVGIRGVETGKDWYWSKDTTEFSQDDGATALSATDTLEVTYQGLVPTIVILQDDAEVTARKAVEGGSGIYERVADEPNIDSVSVASETAFAYLQRDGAIPTQIEFETWEPGLTAGMLVPVTLEREGLSGDFLITSIRASYLIGDTYVSTVTATDGRYVGGWVEYFQRLAAAQRAKDVREDESLIAVRAVSAPVLVGATLDLTVQPAESRIGYLEIGTGEIGE